MKVRFLSRDEIAPKGSLVCVVDVISAFTTAGWLFFQNAERIIVGESIDQSLAIKQEKPAVCLIGENNGFEIDGFDYGNDATQFFGVDFGGRTCVLKTTSGTRGLTLNKNAPCLLAASFCNARATADYIKKSPYNEISFVITNDFKSAEDYACAAYICELIFENSARSVNHYLNIVSTSKYAQDVESNGTGELEYILKADIFKFAITCMRFKDKMILYPNKIN